MKGRVFILNCLSFGFWTHWFKEPYSCWLWDSYAPLFSSSRTCNSFSENSRAENEARMLCRASFNYLQRSLQQHLKSENFMKKSQIFFFSNFLETLEDLATLDLNFPLAPSCQSWVTLPGYTWSKSRQSLAWHTLKTQPASFLYLTFLPLGVFNLDSSLNHSYA